MSVSQTNKKTIIIVAGVGTGGSADALLEILNYFHKAQEFRYIILTSYSHAMERELQSYGYSFIHLPYREFARERLHGVLGVVDVVLRPIIYLVYAISNLVSLYLCEKQIDFENVQLVYSNIDRIDFGAELARRHHLPHVWHLRQHATGHFDMLYKRRNVVSYMNNNANKFIAISDSVRKNWIEWGLEERKIELIYDGVDLDKYTHKQDILGEDIIRIVFVGFLTPVKGQWILLKALSRLDDRIKSKYVIDFIGDGNKEYIGKLRRYASKNGISVSFLGYRKDIPRLLSQYDVGVIISKKEGFGRVTVEYLASGLLTVGNNTGANIEILNNGENGIICSCVDDITSLFSVLPEKRNAMRLIAKVGEHSVRNRFSARINAMNIIELMKSVSVHVD